MSPPACLRSSRRPPMWRSASRRRCCSRAPCCSVWRAPFDGSRFNGAGTNVACPRSRRGYVGTRSRRSIMRQISRRVSLLTRCLPAALLAAVLFPGAAYADPVSIGAHVEGGTTASLTATRTFGNPTPLGQLTLPTDRAALAIANGGPPVQNCVSEASGRGGGSMKNPGGAALVRLLGDDGLSLASSQGGGVGIFLSNNPPNNGGSGSGDQAALDRSVIFVGGPGNGSGNDGQGLIAVVGTPAALRAL